MTEADDTSEDAAPEDNGAATPTKRFRKVKVLEADDGQFYYVAVDRKGEPLYTSETFTRKNTAITAARREHEGRSDKFDYLLEYTNSKGHVVRETL